eukprot:PRCOL_00002340-RA
MDAGGAAAPPRVADIVLIGGGHSHVAVLKMFGMRPLPGVRLTLVARDVHTPYSGMLPGYVAGYYTRDECHVDLGPLCAFAGARLVHATAIGLDLKDKCVMLSGGRPPVAYDALSIDVGITPAFGSVPGAGAHSTAVKPIDGFCARWDAIRADAEDAAGSGRRFELTVVGAGAGGIELALSMHHALTEQAAGRAEVRVRCVTRGEALPTHPAKVRAIFRRIAGEREGFELREHAEVAGVESGAIVLRAEGEGQGERIDHDACVWCTQARAAEWLGASGLATDGDGFVAVHPTLESTSHPGVFAAGDCANVLEHPRPKAGVFAVRQGMPLAENLRRVALGEALKPFAPQKTFMGLITTGNKYAVLSKGGFALEGGWCWTMKDRIDRAWMDKYNKLEFMKQKEVAPPPAAAAAGAEALAAIRAVPMRCGGCGAKVGATVLSRVMARLPKQNLGPEILVGLDAPDDAAVVKVPDGCVTIQTVDFFRAFVSDTYVFGRVAANHALGDVHAMGARPLSALAIATVPFGLDAKVEEDLFEMMAGAVSVLEEAGCALVGGHSCEGAEVSLGFAITGAAKPQEIMHKGGMAPGEAVVLTKPVGTGALFAADMRGQAKGRWVSAALEQMQQSNRQGADVLLAHGASCCTDVTGFGLAGHLIEMAKASGCVARLDMNAVPLLEGAKECVAKGIMSSLQPQNLRLRRGVRGLSPEVTSCDAYPLMFDPTTAGGLLASVPAARARACVEELVRAGYPHACVVGEVVERLAEDAEVLEVLELSTE